MAEKNKPKSIRGQVAKSADILPVTQGADNIAGLGGVEVRISVEWGRVSVPLDQARRLAAGSRLVAEQLANDAVDIRVNGKLFGRGRVVMVDDQYGVQLTEIVG